jgi:hypothetical protein
MVWKVSGRKHSGPNKCIRTEGLKKSTRTVSEYSVFGMRIEPRNFRINVQEAKATHESHWLLFVVERRNFLIGG